MGSLQDQSGPDTFYCDEHLLVNFDRHQAMLDSQAVPLTRKEYYLLALLVEHSGRIVPREALLMLISGYGPGIRTRTLDVHIRRLWRKFGMYADQYIETIYRGGYRFQPFQTRRFPQSAVARP